MRRIERTSVQLGLLGAGLLTLGGLALWWSRHLHIAEDHGLLPHDHVRDAGPGAMQHPPRRWDLVDETSDASFPASDPPGGY